MKLLYINWSTAIFEEFYESNLFNSDTEYHLNECLQDEDHPETYEIDFMPYCESVASYAVELLKDYCILFQENKIIKEMKYISLNFPRFYNYTTDKLNIEIDFNINKLKRFIKNNKTDFNLYLKDNFTSYDGFISFIENNYNDFMNKFYLDSTEKARSLNVMLEYYILTCIYENKWEVIKELSWNDTEYHNKLYECVNEAQYNYAIQVA